MEVLKYIGIALFAASSVIHLYASSKENKKLRNQSKGFILIGLCIWYCTSVSSPAGVVIAALLLSWLGDVLLIPKGVKWFTAGGIAFMASHVCFVLAYSAHVSFSSMPIWCVLLPAAVYLAAVILVFKGLKAYLPKLLFYPMFIYLTVNGTMNCFALYQLISVPCTASVITFIGALFFFASDSILFYVRFKKDTVWKNHFPVMLTYIIGELLITLGLILIA